MEGEQERGNRMRKQGAESRERENEGGSNNKKGCMREQGLRGWEEEGG